VCKSQHRLGSVGLSQSYHSQANPLSRDGHSQRFMNELRSLLYSFCFTVLEVAATMGAVGRWGGGEEGGSAHGGVRGDGDGCVTWLGRPCERRRGWMWEGRSEGDRFAAA
jgi:hypothetical protein